jgi:hypothetical protein
MLLVVTPLALDAAKPMHSHGLKLLLGLNVDNQTAGTRPRTALCLASGLPAYALVFEQSSR